MFKEKDLKRFSVRPRPIRYLLGYLVLFLGGVLAKIVIKGSGNIPLKGPFIVVCNHFNRLDPPFVIYAIKKPINFLMASDQTVENQLMWAPWLYGFIPTNRQNIAPSTIKRSINVLKKGEILGIFPEGGATEQYLRPAKNGAAYLATTANVPILPIGLTGMDNIWNNWFRGIKPKLQINIGEPFVVGALPKDRKERNEALKTTGDEIMFRIAVLVPDRFRGEFGEKQYMNNINETQHKS